MTKPMLQQLEKLGTQEAKILKLLAERGIMSLGELSAKQRLNPGNALESLETLSKSDLVQMRDDPDAVNGILVAITVDGVRFSRE